MSRIPVPLGPASDKSKARQGGGSIITNGYVEKTEGGKSGFSINCRPRLRLFGNTGADAPVRGVCAINGSELYVIAGEGAYSIGPGGAATYLGVVIGQKPCTMSFNRKSPHRQIAITADTKNYVIENSVLTEVTDPDLPSGSHSNCNSNGYTIYGINDGLAYASAENDSTSINALAFAEAERSTDPGVRVLEVGEDFWYFGTKSREVFRIVGTSDPFPCEPLLGAGLGEGSGCAARFSPALLGGFVAWVNDYFQVVLSGGGAPEPISNHEVDRDIERAMKLGYTDEITSFSYDTEGHQFYVLRSPIWCWAYDLATGFWAPWKSYQSDTFKCGHYAYCYNKDLVGGHDGKLYELTFDAMDDDGEACVMEIEVSPPNAFPDGYICDAFHLDIQRGVGIASGAAHTQDPQVLLSVSRDGGMTWGRTYARSAGQQGKYAKDIRWNRLGSCNGTGMGFKLSLPEPVSKAVFQAAVDLRPLRN